MCDQSKKPVVRFAKISEVKQRWGIGQEEKPVPDEVVQVVAEKVTRDISA